MECYRHKRIETNVRCGKCDKPICPKCMIPGPVGMRCPECASLRSSALYKVEPLRLVLTVLTSLVLGFVGAFVISAMSFFILFAGPIYGGIVAEGVLRASGRKRGPMIEAIGVGGIVIANLFVILLPWIMSTIATAAGAPVANAGTVLAWGMFGSIWRLIGVALAISACYGRLKYM